MPKKECKCRTVKLYDDGWHCMLCFDEFVPRPAPLSPEDIQALKDSLGEEIRKALHGS